MATPCGADGPAPGLPAWRPWCMPPLRRLLSGRLYGGGPPLSGSAPGEGGRSALSRRS
ncbi:unnamed protein product [Prorocentrum cordatum]|uniref:Uncharacterized protein n=1 Tax=Prorocentrum cordatum TaxID=2364126 RepID=A0ABN9UVT1_9DINO|nr:unnamed protein product [Polarella glacialis]